AFRPMDGIVDEIALCLGFFKRVKATGLPQERLMTITKNLGMLLLAIYLILVGITLLVHIAIPVLVTGVLALAAGILILIGKQHARGLASYRTPTAREISKTT